MTGVLSRLRGLRMSRQVLHATLNANLVVGGDADQIVVAGRDADLAGVYRLTFTAGPFDQAALGEPACIYPPPSLLAAGRR